MSLSLAGLGRYYGLQQPFNFRVAIPFLLNIALILVVIIIAIALHANGGLFIGTARFYFLCYIGAFVVVAAWFSRVTGFSLAISLWCVTELSLSFITDKLEARGITRSLLPRDIYASTPDPRFEYHAVLGLVPKRNVRGEWHADRRNMMVAERDGLWLNPSYFSDNFYSHNSLGQRGRGLSASDLEKDLIFVYGGSTTYDSSVTQGSTWVERLQAGLNDRFTIVNLGVIAHSTPQHLISTAFYQDALNKAPACALYYVGGNDLGNSHTPDLDPTYANYASLIMHSVVRKRRLWAAEYSPLVRLADRIARHRFDIVPEVPAAHKVTSTAANDERLERLFVDHIVTIIAINRSRSIKTVFVGQIWNTELLSNKDKIQFHRFIENEALWPLQVRLNSTLEKTAASAGAKYIDAGVENFDNSDFADVIHFSATGSAKFAKLISKQVEKYCE